MTTSININPELIPSELKQVDQWIVWKYIPVPGKKPTKVPHNTSGQKCSVTDSANFTTFDNAVSYYSNGGGMDGIGFVVTGTGYTAIDIDHATETKVIQGQERQVMKQSVQELVDDLDSYYERTPSGTGYRVYVKADKPTKRCKRNNFDGTGTDIEIYETDRFLTVTGQFCGRTKTIEPRQEELNRLVQRLWPAQEERASTPPPSLHISDSDLIERIRRSGNGRAFDDYMSMTPDPQLHDWSSLDMGLASILAFWCRGDIDQMDRIFRQSPLANRAKWDDNRGGKTYGRTTLENAVATCGNFYDPESYQSERSDDVPPVLDEQVVAMEEEPEEDAVADFGFEVSKIDLDSLPDPRKKLMKHYYKDFVVGTAAPGGTGKTSVDDVEQVSMCIGKDLLNSREPIRTGQLKVLEFSIEDDAAEKRRRIEAIIRSYALTEEEKALLVQNLHCIHVVKPHQKIAYIDDGKAVQNSIAINWIKNFIWANEIDVVNIDPLISIHDVDENSQLQIVLETLREIAREQGVCVHYSHHNRKGDNNSADDVRGHSSLVSGSRMVRMLKRMTDTEAGDFGIDPDEARFLIGEFSGKANFEPPSEAKVWYRMHSVDLQNETDLYDSDKIGVAHAYTLPKREDVIANVPTETWKKVFDAIGRAPAEQRRVSEQSSAGYIGEIVAQFTQYDAVTDYKKINSCLRQFEALKYLKKARVVIGDKGKEAPVYEIDKPYYGKEEI